MGLFFGFLFVALVYFAPAYIASGKRNSGAIFALNLLLGWTVVGWIAALIWALSNEKAPNTVIVTAQPQPSSASVDTDRYAQLKKLRDEGVLTQEEFMEQIAKLP